jgi:hypothetical protein
MTPLLVKKFLCRGKKRKKGPKQKERKKKTLRKKEKNQTLT